MSDPFDDIGRLLDLLYVSRLKTVVLTVTRSSFPTWKHGHCDIFVVTAHSASVPDPVTNRAHFSLTSYLVFL